MSEKLSNFTETSSRQDEVSPWDSLASGHNPNFSPDPTNSESSSSPESRYSPEEFNKLAEREIMLRNNCIESSNIVSSSVGREIFSIQGAVPHNSFIQDSLEDTRLVFLKESPKVTETLLEAIDSLYPSPFMKNQENNSRGLLEEYGAVNKRKDSRVSNNLYNLANRLPKNNDSDVEIAKSLKMLSEAIFANSTEVVPAMQDYLVSPTDENKKQLLNKFRHLVSDESSDIARLNSSLGIYGNTQTVMEPLQRVRGTVVTSKQETLKAILDYVDFKLEHATSSSNTEESSSFSSSTEDSLSSKSENTGQGGHSNSGPYRGITLSKDDFV